MRSELTITRCAVALLLVAVFSIPTISVVEATQGTDEFGMSKGDFFTFTSSDDSLVVSYDPSGLVYALKYDDWGKAIIEIPGALQQSIPGAPVLPVFNLKLALPPDTDLNSIQIDTCAGDYSVLLDNIPLARGSKIAALYAEDQKIPPSPHLTDDDIRFRSNEYNIYPAFPVTVQGTETMRKWIYVDLLVFPLGYDIEDDTVFQTGEVEIQIKYNRTAGALPYLGRDTFMDDLAADMLDNYFDVKDEYLASPRGSKTGATLAIITRLAISGTSGIPNTQTGVWEYVNWLNSQGLPTIVVNDLHFNSYAGNTVEERAKNWLRSNYQAQDIGYVLLIGDPRRAGEYPDINGQYRLSSLMVRWRSTEPIAAYTDRWWANLDHYTLAAWDLDQDTVFGEFCGDYYFEPECTLRPVGGGVRLVPDVYVGRLPIYNNSTGAQNNLRGVLRAIRWFIENEDLADWREKVLEFGTILNLYDYRNGLGCTDTCDDKGDSSYWLEAQNDDYFTPWGYTTRRIYEHGEPGYEEDDYYDYGAFCDEIRYENTYCEHNGNSNFENTSVIVQMNTYDAGLMFWYGHGSPTNSQRVLWDDLNSNGFPEGGDCNNDEAARVVMIDQASVLDPGNEAKDRRFFAFMGSCNNTRWDHTATEYNLAEAMLGKYAVAAVAATHVLWYRGDTVVDDTSYLLQDLGYKFGKKASTYLLGRQAVGKAVWDANSPTTESPGVGPDNSSIYGNMLHLNLLGDPRVKLRGTL